MATLIELDAADLIHRVDAALSWRQQQNRLFYVLPKAKVWMLEKLPLEDSETGSKIPPNEQLDSFFVFLLRG